MSNLLSNRIAVVTGAASGIGRAIVEKFRNQGAKVIGVDIVGDNDFVDVRSDLSIISTIPNLVAEVFKKVAKVDILVNCAGITRIQMIENLEIELYEKVLNTNLHSAVQLMKLFGTKMCQQKYGRIVNISSIHGQLSAEGCIAYDISKGGLESATRTAAIEFAEFGVLVNALAPGFVETQMSIKEGKNELDSEDVQLIYIRNKKIPIARFAKPTEIAEFAMWLASEGNTYTTGQVINIDGGLTAKF